MQHRQTPAPASPAVLPFSTLRATGRALLISTAVALPQLMQGAAAQTPADVAVGARHYDIAAGPVEQVLASFARASGLLIAFTPDRVEGRSSQGLHGDYGVDQALSALLAGTGLAAERTGDARYTLRVLPPVQGATLLAPVNVEATVDAGTSTEGSGSYTTRAVATAKGQTIKEIPQAVSVITRQQIEDQNMVTLDQVMTYMPGVTTHNLGQGGRGNAYYARGLLMNSVQIDGANVSALPAGGINMEGSNIASMSMYDHVELLRGADGLYSGLGSSPGTVNLVRKRPQRELQTQLALSAGRWDQYQEEVDVTGPLMAGGGLRGRVVYARRDAHGFTDGADDSSDFIYTIGELDLARNTVLAVGGNYTHGDGFPSGSGLTRNADGSDPGFPRSASLVAPWSQYTKDAREYFAEIRHSFNDNWKLMGVFNASDSDNGRYLAKVDQATDNAVMRLRGMQYLEKGRSFDINLTGKGTVFGHGYDVLLGLDHRQSDATFDFRWHFTYDGDAYDRTPVADPRNIDWALYPAPLRYDRDNYGVYSSEQSGLYVRVKLELIEDLHLLTGARFSDYEYRSRSTNYDATGAQTSQSRGRYTESGIPTPYVGLVYDLDRRWTAYGSATEIHQSQANALKGPPPGVQPIDPLQGRNYELGLKGDLAQQRFTTSMALYRLERTGQSARDPAYDYTSDGGGTACCFLNRGDVVSQGVEAEIQGEALPRLDVSASYSYNDVRDEQAGDLRLNTTVAPRHLFKLWSKYQLPGRWSALSAGGGVTGQSETYSVGNGYRYSQGGYAIWSAFGQYQIGERWQLSANLANLFDKTYYSIISDPGYGNYYGEPLRWTLTLRGKF